MSEKTCPKNEYKTTIGLEIHAELKTRTKMFCDCLNDPDEKEPNVNVCPICLGHPGTLPVINREAVKKVLEVGVAIGAELADFTEWDRKNYFYPDIPKGYQISQYKYPLVMGGMINGVKITRIHLEEDTARSSHFESGKGDYSLVDFNRAGVPLMELVTEPVIHSGKEAADFAKELQLILQYLGAGEANMEKGEMRVEANISVSACEKLGTKVEVKNLNSFRAVERAVAYEVERQIKLIESGEKIVQETRGWDEDKQKTFSQRVKEDSHDYRYFPDPDLPKFKLSEIPEFAVEALKKELPELPAEKRLRYEKDYGIKTVDVEIFVKPGFISVFFEKVCEDFAGDRNLIKLASNYIISDLLGLMKGTKAEAQSSENFSDRNFAELMKMIAVGKISSRGAKDILKIMFEQGGEPQVIAEKENLLQQSDTTELKKVMEKIVADNPKVVADYKAGKESAVQFLVGQGMKTTKGAGNPAVLKEIVVGLLKS